MPTRVVGFSSSASYCRRRPASLHDDLAVHPRFVMSRNKAGEFEHTGLRESPKEFTMLSGSKAFSVGIVMLHVGKFFHEHCMLAVFRDRSQHEFVAFGSAIFQDEADLFTLSHSD